MIFWAFVWAFSAIVSYSLIPSLVKSLPKTPSESEINTALWLCVYGPFTLALIVVAIVHCHLSKRFSSLAKKLREEIEKAKAS